VLLINSFFFSQFDKKKSIKLIELKILKNKIHSTTVLPHAINFEMGFKKHDN